MWPPTVATRETAHVFYLALKNRIYKTKHTHIQKAELKALYFNFESLYYKTIFSVLRGLEYRPISRKRLTIEVSGLGELMVLSIHAPLRSVNYAS